MHGALPVNTPTAWWFDATGEHFGQKCVTLDYFPSRALPEVLSFDGVDKAIGIFVDAAAAVHAVPMQALPPDMHRPADGDTYIDKLVGLLGRAEAAVSDSSSTLHCTAAQTARPPPTARRRCRGPSSTATTSRRTCSCPTAGRGS